jgi:hypothetical protein
MIGADEIVRRPMKSILDPSFRYTTSFNTDLAKTFARIRREHRQEAERRSTAEALAKVTPIDRKTATGR